jgi:hypothetical protein
MREPWSGTSMGAKWQVGNQTYQDCDHCGLSYNLAGQLKNNHKDGSCVNTFGDKEGKTYGADTQADSWCTKRESKPNKTGSHVVETSAAPAPAARVETGYA